MKDGSRYDVVLLHQSFSHLISPVSIITTIKSNHVLHLQQTCYVLPATGWSNKEGLWCAKKKVVVARDPCPKKVRHK